MGTFFKKLFISKYALHIIFWALQIFSNALAEITIFDNSPSIYFLNLLVVHAFQIIICSLNVFLLVPQLYKTGKRLGYWLSITGLVLLYSFSLTQIQHLYFKNYFSTSETLSKTFYHIALNGMSIIRYIIVTVLIALAREWLLKTFRDSEQKAEQATSEIRFLRSQLNPHFLLNTLNSIYGLVLSQSSKAKEIILKLSDIMKYTLYESNEERVLLKDDIENVVNYIDLEKMRQGNNAQIKTHVNYGDGNQLICPLLFLPVVENAFKHGLNSQIRNAFLDFSLEADKKYIRVAISNSKASTEKNKAGHAGIGLHNLKRRLSLFYPGKHSIEIDDGRDTYSVKMEIHIA